MAHRWPRGASMSSNASMPTCGPPGHRHVVIMLTPEISEMVDEPITVALPLDDVKRVAPAA
jgi:hypothetical protein